MTLEKFIEKNQLSVSSQKNYLVSLTKFPDIDNLSPLNIFNLINDTKYTEKSKNDRLHNILTYYRTLKMTSKYNTFYKLLKATPFEKARIKAAIEYSKLMKPKKK